MKALLCAAAAAACLVATPAAAQLYGTVGITHMDAEVPEFADAGTLGFEALTGRVGFAFAPVLAVEAEGSFGWEDATTTIADPAGDISVNVGLQHDVAIFAVGRLPMTDNANLFARVGYGWSNAEAEVEDSTGTESFEAEAEGGRWGVGAEFYFDEKNGVRIDFTRISNDEVDADAYGIAYTRRF